MEVAMENMTKSESDAVGVLTNSFCPTGDGGGVDPSCSSSDSGVLPDAKIGVGQSSAAVNIEKSEKMAKKYKCLESQCYANAAKVVAGEDGYTYHEGILVSENGSKMLDHAWTVDKSGAIVDPSLHLNGVYYPLISLSSSQLNKYPKSSSDNHRKLLDMKNVGIDTKLSLLQKIVNGKTPKEIKSEFGYTGKYRPEGGHDYRKYRR